MGILGTAVRDTILGLSPLLSFFFSIPFVPLLVKRGTFKLLGHPTAQPVAASEQVTAALNDPRWGVHKYVMANGIKFHFVEAGPEDAPLVLFLHGFPEFWYSWRHQMESLKGSYRCVAVDMRGYGLSDKPAGKESYVIENLVADVNDLITVLGHDKAVVVAHDWGGSVAWNFAHAHPEKLSALCVMNCPHPRAFKNATFRQLMRSWYIFMFQMPALPEILLSEGDWRAVAVSFAGKSMGIRRKPRQFMSPTDVACMVHMFSQPGVATAAVNYYRSALMKKARWLSGALRRKLMMPVLLLWGEDDGALGKELTENMEEYVEGIQIEYLPNCSHWVQVDAVPEVNALLQGFLEKNKAKFEGRRRLSAASSKL